MSNNNLHLSGGVGRKLFTAFLTVSLFSFASAMVGWVGLGFVRDAQERVLGEVYPSVRDAQIIARESTALVLQLSSLFDASSIDQLESRTKAVKAREERITALLSQFEGEIGFDSLRQQLYPKTAVLTQKVDVLTGLSRQTIEVSSQVDDDLKNLLALSETLIDESKTMVLVVADNTIDDSNTISKLLRSEDRSRQALAANEFEVFVQKNLGNLQEITDLQFRSEAIRDQLILVRDLPSVEQLRITRDELALNLRAITNTVVRLDVPEMERVFAEPLTELSEHIFQASSVFWFQEKILLDRSQMDKVRVSAETVGQDIDKIVETFVLQTQSVMDEQSANMRTVTFRTEFILIAIALLAIGASTTIYFAYINNNIIFRLNRLSLSVSRMADGDLSTSVTSTGNDQITQVEEAVEAFRGNAILLRQTESELQAHSQELERSNQDLQQFAYVTSHDLRAPLRAISSLSEWIEDDLSQGNDEEVSRNLARLRNRVHRMGSLLSGILQYARAGSKEAASTLVDAEAVTRQVFDDLDPEKRFTLSIHCDAEPYFTEETFVQQVLGNLIANAIKHHDKSEGRIEVRISSDDEFNVLKVSDDGPGIPENMREKVLQMFQTLKPRDEMEASGIGLALVKRLVERRSGELFIDQSAIGGACFTIKWPRERE